MNSELLHTELFSPTKNKSERAKIKHGWLSPCIQKIDLITLTRYHISQKTVSLWQFFKLNFWTKKLILCLFINKNPLTIILTKKLTLHFLYKDTTELSYIDLWFFNDVILIFSELECWSNATDNPYHGKQHLWPRQSLKQTGTCHTPWRMTPTQSPPAQNQTLSCQTHFHNLHNHKNFQSKILNN